MTLNVNRRRHPPLLTSPSPPLHTQSVERGEEILRSFRSVRFLLRGTLPSPLLFFHCRVKSKSDAPVCKATHSAGKDSRRGWWGWGGGGQETTPLSSECYATSLFFVKFQQNILSVEISQTVHQGVDRGVVGSGRAGWGLLGYRVVTRAMVRFTTGSRSENEEMLSEAFYW